MAIHFKGSRADVRQLATRLRNILAGVESDQYGVGVGFLTALGFGALSDIKDAYVTKAAGGTDEMGVKWPPLKPSTIAGRRVGPRDMKAGPHTSESQAYAIRQRENARKAAYRKLLRRLRISLPEAEAVARATRLSNIAATKKTGRTRLQTLGSRYVEILRDTGQLLNSLSPGVYDGKNTYTKPTGEGGKNQIFDPRPGMIVVGTNDPKAAFHQHGTRTIPRRQFLPDSESQIPDVWWQRWLDIGVKALRVGAEILYRGAA